MGRFAVPAPARRSSRVFADARPAAAFPGNALSAESGRREKSGGLHKIGRHQGNGGGLDVFDAFHRRAQCFLDGGRRGAHGKRVRGGEFVVAPQAERIKHLFHGRTPALKRICKGGEGTGRQLEPQRLGPGRRRRGRPWRSRRRPCKWEKRERGLRLPLRGRKLERVEHRKSGAIGGRGRKVRPRLAPGLGLASAAGYGLGGRIHGSAGDGQGRRRATDHDFSCALRHFCLQSE